MTEGIIQKVFLEFNNKCEFQNERLGLQIYLLEKLEFVANYTLIRNSVSLWNKSVCLGNCTGCRCSDCSYNYNKSISKLSVYIYNYQSIDVLKVVQHGVGGLMFGVGAILKTTF